MQCIVSCAKKYFMGTQLSSLNLDSFTFQLRQWALESQGVFGYLQMLIFVDESFVKSLLFKVGRTKRWSKSSLTREQISIDSNVAFLLVWTAFTSSIFDILLKLLFVFFCFFFIWCLEIIMTSCVRSYF